MGMTKGENDAQHGLTNFLHTLHPLYSSKRAALNLPLAILITVTGITPSGCARDEKPPAIQQYEIGDWAVENEDINLKVNTLDDRGVEEVYIQFDGGEPEALTKTYSKEIEGGEESTWGATSFKLSPGERSFSIVAEDKAGNKSDPKEGKITVYSKNSLYGYARGKGIDTYLSQLVSLEDNGAVDGNGKAFIDLVVNYPKAGELVPGIYAELLLLPDLSMEKYSKIDERDLEAVEKILKLASDPKYTSAFLSIDSVGIKDGRKYGALWEALLWEAFDDKNLSDLLEPYSMEKLVKDAWTNTSTSRNYSRARWGDYSEVVARLSFPEGGYRFVKDKMNFKISMTVELDPKEFFDKKEGDCSEYSLFITHTLLKSGFPLYKKEYDQTNAVCSLGIWTTDPSAGGYGHMVCVVKRNNQFHCFDATPFGSKNRESFKNMEDLLNATVSGWNLSLIVGDQAYKATEAIVSEYGKGRLKEDKNVREYVKNVFKSSEWLNEKNKEHNKWLIDYIDSFGK